jgi:hypothetical protein
LAEGVCAMIGFRIATYKFSKSSHDLLSLERVQIFNKVCTFFRAET